MSYRDKLYSKYVSTQTSRLYGKQNFDSIKKQFPAWQSYFGKFLPQNKNVKILDIGCGNGGFVYWLQRLGYQNAEGIDISKEQIEVAQKLGIKNIRQEDIKKFLNFGTSDVLGTSEVQSIKYDIIFCRDVLEHFNKEEILDILEKIYKILNNNGVLVIQAPNAESSFSGKIRYGDFTHEISFTETSIRQILLATGFREITIYSQPPVIHGLKSLIRYLLWRLIELKLRFYLLVETGSSQGIFTQNLIAVAKK